MTKTIIQTNWSKEQVQRLLEEEKLDYQNIELPYGLTTGGHDRSATAQAIFPADLSGKSVLDVGCMNGYFCFEALKRGAKRARGLEIKDERVRAARRVADCLNLPAEFETFDIEADDIKDKWDYVICLNVLHHLRDPIRAIDKLAAITRESLILEIAGLSRYDSHKSGIPAILLPIFERAPILIAAHPARAGSQTFYMTAAGVRNLLAQRKSFAKTAIKRSPFRGRLIAHVQKKKIGQLLIVAGPSAAGKSTLMQRLQTGDCPEIRQRLNLQSGVAWESMDAKNFGDFTGTHKVENLLFHYELLRTHFSKLSTKSFGQDVALDILTCADTTQILTVWTPPEVLYERIQTRDIDPGTQDGRYKGPKRRPEKHEMYAKGAAIVSVYAEWIEFCRRIGLSHTIVSVEGDKTNFWTPDEWKEQVLPEYLKERK